MENNRTKNIRVGIFLAIGSFVIFASIILLGGERALFKKHVYLYATMDQVQGLDRGSIVSLAGVVVGNVSTIQFSSEKNALVLQFKIDDDFLPQLNKGVRADVRTQGALGDKYIYLTPGDSKSEPLKSGDFIETSKSADLMGILSEKGGEATKIFDIIDEVYRLTKIINADGRSDKIMMNFVETSQNLKVMSDDARKMMAELHGQNPNNMKESMQHLNSILTKIDRGDGSLGALINDPSIHERLKTVLGADAHKQSIQSLIRTSIQKSGN